MKLTKIKTIKGNLIDLALKGKFDVIIHGCNIYNVMANGIAVEMANTFNCNKFPLEMESYKGDINKLGQIDYKSYFVSSRGEYDIFSHSQNPVFDRELTVINAYTQHYFKHPTMKITAELDLDAFQYEAFKIILKKVNYLFAGKHIGFPKIGSGISGGNWDIILAIIQLNLPDMEVTIIEFDQ